MIVMPYLEGYQTLEELKEQAVITEPQIRKFTRQIIQALKCLHDKKLTHGNLKLGNIFINQQ